MDLSFSKIRLSDLGRHGACSSERVCEVVVGVDGGVVVVWWWGCQGGGGHAPQNSSHDVVFVLREERASRLVWT
jgi:hypothetical protein